MAVVTIRQLLDSGVHFGHQTRRWNPKVKRFILAERSGIHIIDLQQSLTYIDQAYDFVKQTVARGGSVLFVGTKKQAQESIAEQAMRVGQPFVNQRWLGGLLTNFNTISQRLARMKELEQLDYEDASKSGFTKKELLIKKRELDKLHKSLGGIRNLQKTPSALWVVDTKKEHLAIDEAKKLGIPAISTGDIIRAEVKAAGYVMGLKEAGYTCAEAKAGNYTCAQVKMAGYTLAEMRTAGFTCAEAKAAGFNPKESMQAGFTYQEGLAVGYPSHIDGHPTNVTSWNFGMQPPRLESMISLPALPPPPRARPSVQRPMRRAAALRAARALRAACWRSDPCCRLTPARVRAWRRGL
jgi:ribosomal protein S2